MVAILRRRLSPPALEIGHGAGERVAGAGRQFRAFGELQGGGIERHILRARCLVDRLKRRVSDAAPGLVQHPLEGQIVGRLRGEPQIGGGVPDLLALIETQAAIDAVGHANGQETLLELAALKARAH